MFKRLKRGKQLKNQVQTTALNIQTTKQLLFKHLRRIQTKTSLKSLYVGNLNFTKESPLKWTTSVSKKLISLGNLHLNEPRRYCQTIFLKPYTLIKKFTLQKSVSKLPIIDYPLYFKPKRGYLENLNYFIQHNQNRLINQLTKTASVWRERIQPQIIPRTGKNFIFKNFGIFLTSQTLFNQSNPFTYKYLFKKKLFSFLYPNEVRNSLMNRKKKNRVLPISF